MVTIGKSLGVLTGLFASYYTMKGIYKVEKAKAEKQDSYYKHFF